jgi:hypothetical protein
MNTTVLGGGRAVRRVRLLRGFSVVVSAIVLASAVGVATAPPAAAEIPPFVICTEHNSSPPLPVGQRETQFAIDGTGDFAIWECRRTRSTPYLYYWQASDIGNNDEEAEDIGTTAKRFAGSVLWEALIQGGYAIFPTSTHHRAHLRYEGSFELWDGDGESTLTRDMGVHMVLKHYSGGAWTACADTGWHNAPEPRARTSYTFYKLTASCPGSLQLFVQAHFFQLSTHTWWTSPWVAGKVHTPLPS